MKKYLIIWSILSISSCNLFNSGSYGNAEYYDFNFTTQELIHRVNEFKHNNPQFVTKIYSDESDQSGNFYNIYFYLEDEKALVYCILRTGKNRKNDRAVLGFHYIESETNFSLDGRINTNDLSKDENQRIKKKFETDILDKLGKWH
jgi:hypothetical protein